MHSENSLFSCVGNFRCKQLKTLVDFKMKIARRGIFFKIPCYFSPRIANRPANPPFIDGNVDWMHSENSLFSCVGNFRCKQLKTLVDFKMKIAGRGIFSKFSVIFPPGNLDANRPAHPHGNMVGC